MKETAELAGFLNIGQPRASNHCEEVLRETSILIAADYVWFLHVGCGGLCAVVITTHRSSLPELKNAHT